MHPTALGWTPSSADTALQGRSADPQMGGLILFAQAHLAERDHWVSDDDCTWAGTYRGGITDLTCVSCPAGSFSANPGATGCTTAPAGTYVNSTASAAATPCPVGERKPYR